MDLKLAADRATVPAKIDYKIAIDVERKLIAIHITVGPLQTELTLDCEAAEKFSQALLAAVHRVQDRRVALTDIRGRVQG